MIGDGTANMYYPDETVEEVLRANNIVDVVGSYVHLQKRGANHFGLCPFHSEKTPSFSVSESKQIFYCFGCGVGGNAATFLMKYENYSFQEALQSLAERAGIALPEVSYSEEAAKREEKRKKLLEINKETATYYYRLLRSGRGRSGAAYFKDRKLTPETMQQFGLGYADGASSDLVRHLRDKGFADDLILEAGVAVFDERRGMHDKFWNRVMFPIMDVRGHVIGFGGRVLGEGKPKYLNSPETPVFDKSRNLYGLNLAKRSNAPYFILCEGYMDVIAMHQAGYPQAVASLGTSFTEGQAALIRRYGRRVLLAYDSDGAGVRAAMRAIGILNRAGISAAVIDLRPQKDPDEFIKANGREAFQDRIDHAENSFFYELRIMERDYRMDDPGQRTQFHHAVARRLSEIDDEIERENYLEETASRYYIKAESLRRLTDSYANVARNESGGNRTRGDDRIRGGAYAARHTGNASYLGKGPEPPGPAANISAGSGGNTAETKDSEPVLQPNTTRSEGLMLTWLADEPSIFHQIRPYLSPSHFQEGVPRRTAERYWKVLEENDSGNLASVIGMFDTDKEQEIAASLFNMRLSGLGTVKEREKALKEILIAIRKDAAERERKALSAGTGSEDAGAMQRILKSKKDLQELKKINIHLPQ